MNDLTIIMYHYVRELKDSRYPDIKGLDLNYFIEQIEYLKTHYNIVSMEEVIDNIDNNNNLPPKAVLLTFDDGYMDHYTNVFPILDKYKIKGSFYPPAKAITENVVLDVNKIHFILAAAHDKLEIVKDLNVLLNSYTQQYQLERFETYYKKLAIECRYDSKDVIFIKRLLQVELVEELRTKIVDILFAKYVGISEAAFSKELYMNQDQLMHMRRNGMHIGSHGFNHYWWGRLNNDELKEELDLSIHFLKSLGVNMTTWTACYPYGSYDERVISMLNEKNCKLALTTEVNIATTKKEARLIMPRLDTNDIPKNRYIPTNEWYDRSK